MICIGKLLITGGNSEMSYTCMVYILFLQGGYMGGGGGARPPLDHLLPPISLPPPSSYFLFPSTHSNVQCNGSGCIRLLHTYLLPISC